SYLSSLTNVNGTLFFTANNFGNSAQLWKSDGTAAGTVQVSNAVQNVRFLTNVNGTLFFTADDGTHGEGPWKGDGRAAGTVLVADVNTIDLNSNPADFVASNGSVFFAAYDGHGQGLWKTDGTAAGTVLVSYATDPGFLTDVNGTLFLATDGGLV